MEGGSEADVSRGLAHTHTTCRLLGPEGLLEPEGVGGGHLHPEEVVARHPEPEGVGVYHPPEGEVVVGVPGHPQVEGHLFPVYQD